VQSRRLFQSDFYEIKRWEMHMTPQDGRGESYNDCFCLVFVQKSSPTPCSRWKAGP